MKAQELIDRAELHKINDKLSDSIQLWNEVVEQYPGTEQSAYALEQLNKHTSQNVKNKNSSNAIGLIFAIFIAYFAFQMVSTFSKNSAEVASTSSTHTKTDIAPIIAFTTITDAEGISENDFTQDNLKIIEKATLAMMLKKGKSNFAEQGYDPKNYNPNFSAKSRYFIVDGKKLAVIKVNADNIARAVSIFGLINNEQITVNCVRKSNHDIPLWSGNCATEIKKSLNVQLDIEQSGTDHD